MSFQRFLLCKEFSTDVCWSEWVGVLGRFLNFFWMITYNLYQKMRYPVNSWEFWFYVVNCILISWGHMTLIASVYGKIQRSHFTIMSDIRHFSILLVTSKFAKHSMFNTLIIFQLDYWSRKEKEKARSFRFLVLALSQQSHTLGFSNYTYDMMRLTIPEAYTQFSVKLL